MVCSFYFTDGIFLLFKTLNLFKEYKTMLLITIIIALLFILALVSSIDYQNNNNTKNDIRMSHRYYYFKNCNIYNIYKDDFRSDQLPYSYYENDRLYSNNHYNNNMLDYKKQYKVIDVKRYKKSNSNKNNRWW